MYIHDVISDIRTRINDIKVDLVGMHSVVHMMEVYLSMVSDYPQPGKCDHDVSRETASEGEGNGTTYQPPIPYL